ncbi:catalase [Ramlibacter sp. PS4R-6]|uniref:catalase n=1 Tax=Ramlibacter sp. PS4R-6 TaxID=3133438 RepID=UPI0030B6C0EA
MPQSKQESQRRAKANEAAAAKLKQLEAFAEPSEGALTTPDGIAVTDNHGSLRAGTRGPLLAEDFFLRDKLAHFERERIPERVVWARGAGAHGYFELTRPLGEYTSAGFLNDAGVRTPVFVRFSNLTGSQGSADTVRDMRGFAVKFYTREGNWDLVGANMPVFFVQDAMKFPDLVHALKPEPHHGMPQASSAHDTFWDFASLMPESTHALMWLMSDRALPRSWRMMDGFGVHAFRFVNAHGVPHFVKFHWKARLGRHALLQAEARRIAGLDADFLRRDLWDAIEQGCFPEWELALQLIPEAKAASLGFDLLDPTKLVPEELVPPLVVGKLVLNRNPDDFFAESEQVAFHPGRLVPGIEFTGDPLLQGRLMSYTGSQMARLGGPNYAQLPINRPVCPVHAFHRDGAHRTAIGQGAVSYEPSSLATGAEVRVDGGREAPQPHANGVEARTRLRANEFDDHFSQASFFWNSVSPAERDHIVGAFQHELAQVRVPAIRQRVVDNLAHVDSRLARKVAEAVGAAAPDAKAAAGRAGFRELRLKLPIETSPALAMENGNGHGIATRRVAVLVAPGVEVGALRALQQALEEARARCILLAERIGSVATAAGQQLQVDESLCSSASVLFDAVIVPGGAACVEALAANGHAMHFIHEAFKHGKTVCVIGDALKLLEPLGLGDAQAAAAVAGVIVGRNDPPSRVQLVQDFLAALARHRHWTRAHLDRVAA